MFGFCWVTLKDYGYWKWGYFSSVLLADMLLRILPNAVLVSMTIVCSLICVPVQLISQMFQGNLGQTEGRTKLLDGLGKFHSIDNPEVCCPSLPFQGTIVAAVLNFWKQCAE